MQKRKYNTKESIIVILAWALGKVLQSGKTLTVCEGYVLDRNEDKLIARMTATMIAV